VNVATEKLQLGVLEIAKAIKEGSTSSAEVVQSFLDRIRRLDPSLHAFVSVDAEGALRQAERADSELRAGRCLGPLHGVPVVYKDVFHIEGLPNTCGTQSLNYFTSATDATVVKRLREAGTITMGKVTLSELAMGLFGLNEVQGTAINPWTPDRVPGGSSSGCAVAVAAGLAPAAIGTDTGGSIRIPAACCGVAGLKPTDGLVGRSGMMPMCYTLDQVGPMAKRVRDLGPLLSIMAGYDAEDVRSVRHDLPDYLSGCAVSGIRVGVPTLEYFADVSSDISSALAVAFEVMRELGMEVQPVSVPEPQPMINATLTMVRAESAAAHAGRLTDQTDVLQPMLRERLRDGSRITAVAYIDALRVWAAYRKDFVREVFAKVDALVVPCVPEPPPLLREVGAHTEEVTRRLARFGKFMRFFNGLGIPVLALPCGFTSDGIPLGMQIAARPFEDNRLLAIGSAYEAATLWSARWPALARSA